MKVATLLAKFVVLNEFRVFRKVTSLFRGRPAPKDVG